MKDKGWYQESTSLVPHCGEEFAALVLLELLGSSASPKDHILGESFTKIIIDSLHPPA